MSLDKSITHGKDHRKKGRMGMTNQEAIEELKYDCEQMGKAIPCDTGWGMAINEAYSMAVAALEKQIPKKPIRDGLYACPNCHKLMLQGAFEAKGKCCKECGQAIDWSE